MTRYQIDPARSRVRYAGEASGLLAMTFDNDASRTTGELAWDEGSDEPLTGAIETIFEALPGGPATTSFRKLLGVLAPHRLRVDQLHVNEMFVEARMDLGRGPVVDALEVTRFETSEDELAITLIGRLGLGGTSDLFAVDKQRGGVMVSGAFELTLEIVGVAA